MEVFLLHLLLSCYTVPGLRKASSVWSFLRCPVPGLRKASSVWSFLRCLCSGSFFVALLALYTDL